MKVFVVDNVHLIKDSVGNYYAKSIYSYNFLKRYLNVFDEVQFIGKIMPAGAGEISKANLLSGPGVSVVELPWYQGIKEMLLIMPELIKIYRESGKNVDGFVFRIAQIESFFVYLFGRNNKQKYVVEVVNDPETFSNLNYFMRKFCVFMVKYLCKNAQGASYVTEKALQNKYPSAKALGKKKRFESYYSSVSLEEKDVSSEPIIHNEDKFRIIHVSNAINDDLKGHYTLINMAKKLSDMNINFEVICVGDGTKVDEYKSYITKNGLDGIVKFVGRINNKDELLELLRNSDLMVLPTKMEGLPRTIIEAMAKGLPCLSTPIAGIPELLSENYLFDPDDYLGFANKVASLISNPEELNKMSIENLKKAKEFIEPVLSKRRTDFYMEFRKSIEESK